jgi:hypothetical protein
MQHNLKTISPTSRQSGNVNRGPVDRRIRAFLAGETHGEELLHALYGHVAAEPVPERLTALLKR